MIPEYAVADGQRVTYASLDGLAVWRARLQADYDPFDLSTMYQDHLGSVPAAFGHTVGLILDKSGLGFHASQEVQTARPILGRVPVTGARNRLTNTEDFTNAAWRKNNVTLTYGQAGPRGALDAVKIVPAAGERALTLDGPSVGIDPINKTVSACFKSSGARYALIGWSNGGGYTATACFDLEQGRVVSLGAHPSTAPAGTISAEAVSEGDGWWKCIVRTTDVSSMQMLHFSASIAPAFSPYGRGLTGDGENGVLIWHPQVEAGAEATSYQRVGVNHHDVTEQGVNELRYLHFDGVDDFLQTTTALVGAGGPFYAAAGVQALAFTGAPLGVIFFGAHLSAVNYANLAARLSGGGVGYAYAMVRTAGGAPTTILTHGLADSRPHVVSGGYQRGEVAVRLDDRPPVSGQRTDPLTFTGYIQIGPGANGGAALNFFGGVYVVRDNVSPAEMEEVERQLAARIREGVLS